jgi:hypothetical protein
MCPISVFVVTLDLVAVNVAGPSEPKSVALGQSFELRVGESARIEAEALQIGFEDVSADSRCPKGDQCTWEGDATVRVWLRTASETRETHELHTSSKEPVAASYRGYGISLLRLDPYPRSGRTIARGAYLATFEVILGSPDTPDR